MTRQTSARLNRVLIAELDSVAQRALHDGLGRADAEHALVGVLRAAHLLSGTILVTDSMLLDSHFFTAVGPHELATRLGVASNRLPLCVVSPDGSLRDALAAKLANEGFHWQLGDGRPHQEWVDDRIWAGWQAWIEAEEAQYVAREPYKQPFSLDVDFGDHSGHDHVAAFVTRAGEAGSARSLVYAAHAEIRSAAPTHLHPELDTLREVWNFAYLQAMAEQQQASWITLQTPQVPAAKRAAGHGALQISGELRTLITDAPPPVYAQMAFAAREPAERFKTDPTQRHLLSLAFALDSATSTDSLRGTRLGAIMSVLAAVIAGALSVVQNDGQHLSPLRAIIITLLVVAITFPWTAISAWRRTHQRRTAGLLAIGGTR
jgi:hypothetical protein